MALNGFDGNGNFLRTFPEGGWKGDATAGIKIRADRHDDHDQALANALSNMICKDGQTTILADIPFNGKKITGLGAPTLPTDAVNKTYADSVKTFTTGTEVSGADLNGRVTFTSPTGANGLAWTGADLSWIARLATAAGPGTPPVPPATINRLALNDKADGTGTDVVEVRDDGSIKAGAISVASLATTGAVTVAGDITASGNASFASVTATGAVFASTAGALYLRPHGVSNATAQTVIAGDGQVTFYNAINVAAGGVLGGQGYRCRGGTGGSYSSSTFNFLWSAPYVYSYIDNTQVGAIQMVCDYRVKKDITLLPSMWDKVKALSPIQYSIREWGIFTNDDTPRWGFIAHELQERLTQSAATGHKDEENVIQSPDLMALVAALTRALQEAMARIEALEAA